MREAPLRADPPAFASWARRCAKRASAKRRKIRPRTGAEYCAALSPEFARNWSAAAHRRFSNVSFAVSFSVGATQRIFVFLPINGGHYDGIERAARLTEQEPWFVIRD